MRIRRFATNRFCSVAAAFLMVLLNAVPASATVSTITLFSPSNNRDLSFQVYTPPGYSAEPSRRYPVVFSLHGIGGNSLQRANLYGPTLDSRIASTQIAPMIWVFPDGQSNSFYGDAFDGHKQVSSHVIGDVLPYVDANYRTIDNRSYRAMEGFSMGGFGAAMYAAKHPELFSAVVEYGGALARWQDLIQFNNAVAVEMYDAVETNFLPFSLWDLTTTNATALKTNVNYKMIVGDADSQHQSNVRFRDHLVSLGIDPQFQVLAGVEHVGGAYLTEGSGVRFLNDHFIAMFRRNGDYNGSGSIDMTDYTAWRAAFGSTTQLFADGNGDGIVNAADYAVWRDKLSIGATDSASALAVPEPLSFWLMSVGAILGWSGRRRLGR